MNPTNEYSDGEDYIDLIKDIDLLKLKHRAIMKPSKSINYNHIPRNELPSRYSRIYSNKKMFQNLAGLKSQSGFEMSPPNSLKSSRQNFKSDINIPDDIPCNRQPSISTITETKEESKPKEDSSTIWKDPRLKEKYSVLKVPWNRRSHTVPIDKSKISLQSKENYTKEIVYAKNYRYDDGSEVDSTSSVNECKICTSLKFIQQAIKTPFLVLLDCGTYVSAFLIVCLALWFLTNPNLILNALFQPKPPPESQLTKLFKYFGGMIMHSFNTAISGTQQVFGLSTKIVYNQPTDNWPPKFY